MSVHCIKPNKKKLNYKFSFNFKCQFWVKGESKDRNLEKFINKVRIASQLYLLCLLHFKEM